MSNPTAIGTITQKLLSPVFEEHKQLELMMQWPAIVGREISAYTWPQKVLLSPKMGTLYVGVKRSFELQAWSVSSLIIERINQYFGSSLVSRIRFLRGS